MQRRAILKYTALATGAAIASPLLTTFLSGCQTEPTAAKIPDFKPQFFDTEAFRIVQQLIDLMLPKTDSPAATEVGVHQLIDGVLDQVYLPKDQEAYRERWMAFLQVLNPAEGSAFLKQNQSEQLEQLHELGTSTSEALAPARQAYLELRQQAIAYYLSTEEIGTQFLNYLPVPGAYEACIPLGKFGGKAWTI